MYLPPRANQTSPLSPAELRFALKASRIGTWALDLNTLELTASEACKLNFGRDVDHPFSYAELLAAVHPSDQLRMRDAVQRSIRSGEEYEIEYRLITPRGEVRWAHIRAQTSFCADGTPEALFGISVDITERRRAEIELRQTADCLALVTELVDVGLWDVDLVNRTLTLPGRTKEILGFPPDASVDLQDLHSMVHADDRNAAEEAYRSALDPARRAIFELECRIIAPTLTHPQRVAIKGRGIFDETGRCVRVMGVAKEASDSRRR